MFCTTVNITVICQKCCLIENFTLICTRDHYNFQKIYRNKEKYIPSKHETLKQWCFNVFHRMRWWPSINHHWCNVSCLHHNCWSQQTAFVSHLHNVGPTSRTLGQSYLSVLCLGLREQKGKAEQILLWLCSDDRVCIFKAKFILKLGQYIYVFRQISNQIK